MDIPVSLEDGSVERDLAEFLERHEPLSKEVEEWGGGSKLRITAYLSAEQPPVDYITSVRCLLFRDGAVLVQRDITGVHILPGGRREPGETLEQTLCREVLEETGWTMGRASMLGFMRFHHLSHRPPGHVYTFPDFLQVVYTAQAVLLVPEGRLDDGYELGSAFRPVAAVQAMALSSRERLYLDAATRPMADR